MKTSTHIYLDYAAATPLDPKVKRVMDPYFSLSFYNPSATYLAAQQVAKAISAARSQIAAMLGCRPAEVVFTAGGSEANNLAVQGVMQAHPGANVVMSAVEHDSVLKPALEYTNKICPVGPDGRIDIAQLEAKIDDSTVLVSLIYGNNEIGTIQPIRDAARLVNKLKAERLRRGNKLPLYLHTDACQAAGYLDLHVKRLGVDMLTLNGGKVYGPKQSGALFIKAGTVLKPQILGGGQEYGLRSGTENVPAIIGLAAALDLAQSRREFEAVRLRELQTAFVELVKNKLPNVTVNGSLNHRLPNNLHLTFPGFDNERLMMQLDEAGILCATGSACSASDEEPSHVLKAIGLTDAEAQSSLRFSMGRDTNEAQIRRTIKLLVSITGTAQAKALY